MDGNKVSKEVKKVEENFKQWLVASNLSEKEFLSYGIITDFMISCDKDTGYNVIAIGHSINGAFERIGEQFVYLENDTSTFMDLALLLLFMAQKLDEAAQRKEYFYNKVKNFIVNMEEYGIVLK